MHWYGVSNNDELVDYAYAYVCLLSQQWYRFHILFFICIILLQNCKNLWTWITGWALSIYIKIRSLRLKRNTAHCGTTNFRHMYSHVSRCIRRRPNISITFMCIYFANFSLTYIYTNAIFVMTNYASNDSACCNFWHR